MIEYIAKLRFRVALNYFKKCLLGGAHIPGKPQTSAVVQALELLAPVDNRSSPPTQPTWNSWFSQKVVPKRRKVEVLDQIRNDIEKSGNPTNFLQEMIFGGLVSVMTQPSRTKDQELHLKIKAEQYNPISPIHLFLDAAEIVTLKTDFQDPISLSLRQVASFKLKSILYSRWNPRDGSVYPEFHSNFHDQLGISNTTQKKNVRSQFDTYKPNITDLLSDKVPTPDWSLVGIDDDVAPEHIHKLLLSMSADTSFLTTDHRLSTWALDLVISTLALFSGALTHRFLIFGKRASPEAQHLNALYTALFKSRDNTDYEYIELPTSHEQNYGFHKMHIEIFDKARISLERILNPLDISLSEFSRCITDTWNENPIIYR